MIGGLRRVRRAGRGGSCTASVISRRVLLPTPRRRCSRRRREREQVADGQHVDPVQGVGGPRAEAQLGDRRVERGRPAAASRPRPSPRGRWTPACSMPSKPAARPGASPRRCRTARRDCAAGPCGRRRSAARAGRRRTARRRSSTSQSSMAGSLLPSPHFGQRRRWPSRTASRRPRTARRAGPSAAACGAARNGSR